MTPRLASVRILQQVLEHGRSLTSELDKALPSLATPADRALTQALCYGSLRWYPQLAFVLEQLLSKPLRQKDSDVQCLLLLGLFQLMHMRIPDHAAVSETVHTTKPLKKKWAKDLVNAVLRQYRRKEATLQAAIDKHPVARFAHPQWLLELLQQAWPEQWQDILAANNQQPPMTLRVNAQQGGREAYRHKLAAKGAEAMPCPHAEQALTLATPAGVESLPGFASGEVSIQDCAAQLAAGLLDAQAGERILDACAAPGGKTCHILERQAKLKELVALDVDQQRLQRIQENLQRLRLKATLVCGDASKPQTWWDGELFDRILLDAPCSATGVIRRHPDIKILRRTSDIADLQQLQQQILTNLWPLLKPGGMLLYATCSVLPPENAQQVAQFLQQTSDARLGPISGTWGQTTPAGQQILPGEDQMDGFFYAPIIKTA